LAFRREVMPPSGCDARVMEAPECLSKYTRHGKRCRERNWAASLLTRTIGSQAHATMRGCRVIVKHAHLRSGSERAVGTTHPSRG
jgi:hypothetical protein